MILKCNFTLHFQYQNETEVRWIVITDTQNTKLLISWIEPDCKTSCSKKNHGLWEKKTLIITN